MPRFYYQQMGDVSAPADATVQVVCRVLDEIGGKPQVAGGRVTAKLGHWLRTRFVGGAFVPEKWLPLDVVVDVADRGDHRQIVVNVAERVGFGMLIGMEARLREHCSRTAAYVRDAVVYRLTTGG